MIKIRKSIWMSFKKKKNNLVIALCNQRVRRLKSTRFFKKEKLLRIFNSFHYAF